MTKKRISAAEQFRLVTECRQSGLTDAGWCRENNISISTFYNWTSRLKKRGIALPVPSCTAAGEKHEVVRLDIIDCDHTVVEMSDGCSGQAGDRSLPAVCEEAKYSHPVMELSFGDVSLKISNDVDPLLLSSLMKNLRVES